MKCEYCTGYRKDRESIINRINPKLDVFINEQNEIEAYDGHSYITYPVNFCPICGRELKGE